MECFHPEQQSVQLPNAESQEEAVVAVDKFDVVEVNFETVGLPNWSIGLIELDFHLEVKPSNGCQLIRDAFKIKHGVVSSCITDAYHRKSDGNLYYNCLKDEVHRMQNRNSSFRSPRSVYSVLAGTLGLKETDLQGSKYIDLMYLKRLMMSPDWKDFPSYVMKMLVRSENDSKCIVCDSGHITRIVKDCDDYFITAYDLGLPTPRILMYPQKPTAMSAGPKDGKRCLWLKTNAHVSGVKAYEENFARVVSLMSGGGDMLCYHCKQLDGHFHAHLYPSKDVFKVGGFYMSSYAMCVGFDLLNIFIRVLKHGRIMMKNPLSLLPLPISLAAEYLAGESNLWVLLELVLIICFGLIPNEGCSASMPKEDLWPFLIDRGQHLEFDGKLSFIIGLMYKGWVPMLRRIYELYDISCFENVKIIIVDLIEVGETNWKFFLG